MDWRVFTQYVNKYTSIQSSKAHHAVFISVGANFDLIEATLIDFQGQFMLSFELQNFPTSKVALKSSQ